MNAYKRSLIILNILCFLFTFSLSTTIYYVKNPPIEAHAVAVVDDVVIAGVVLVTAVSTILLTAYHFKSTDDLNFSVQHVVRNLSGPEKWIIEKAFSNGMVAKFAKWLFLKVLKLGGEAHKDANSSGSTAVVDNHLYKGYQPVKKTHSVYYPFIDFGNGEAETDYIVKDKFVDKSCTSITYNAVKFWIENPDKETYTYIIGDTATSSQHISILWGKQRAFVQVREKGQFTYRAVILGDDGQWRLQGDFINSWFANNKDVIGADVISPQAPTARDANAQDLIDATNNIDTSAPDVIGVSIPDSMGIDNIKQWDLANANVSADIMDSNAGSYDLSNCPDVITGLADAYPLTATDTGAVTVDNSKVDSVTYEGTQDKADTNTGTDTGAGTDVDTDAKIDWSPLYNVGGALKNVFPFCVPFDLYNILSLFTAEAIAPNFILDFSSFPLVSNLSYNLNFSAFDSIAKLIRSCELILYIIFLILVTKKIIS